jgi:hypothetical protein
MWGTYSMLMAVYNLWRIIERSIWFSMWSKLNTSICGVACYSMMCGNAKYDERQAWYQPGRDLSGKSNGSQWLLYVNMKVKRREPKLRRSGGRILEFHSALWAWNVYRIDDDREHIGMTLKRIEMTNAIKRSGQKEYMTIMSVVRTTKNGAIIN